MPVPSVHFFWSIFFSVLRVFSFLVQGVWNEGLTAVSLVSPAVLGYFSSCSGFNQPLGCTVAAESHRGFAPPGECPIFASVATFFFNSMFDNQCDRFRCIDMTRKTIQLHAEWSVVVMTQPPSGSQAVSPQVQLQMHQIASCLTHLNFLIEFWVNLFAATVEQSKLI